MLRTREITKKPKLKAITRTNLEETKNYNKNIKASSEQWLQDEQWLAGGMNGAHWMQISQPFKIFALLHFLRIFCSSFLLVSDLKC